MSTTPVIEFEIAHEQGVGGRHAGVLTANQWWFGADEDHDTEFYRGGSYNPGKPGWKYDVALAKWRFTNDGATWQDWGGGGGGAGVTRYGNTTDQILPRWRGANADVIQGSGISVDDNDNLSTPGKLIRVGTANYNWASTLKVLQLGDTYAIHGGGAMGDAHNLFFDGSAYRYMTSGPGGCVGRGGGAWWFGTAPAGRRARWPRSPSGRSSATTARRSLTNGSG